MPEVVLNSLLFCLISCIDEVQCRDTWNALMLVAYSLNFLSPCVRPTVNRSLHNDDQPLGGISEPRYLSSYGTLRFHDTEGCVVVQQLQSYSARFTRRWVPTTGNGPPISERQGIPRMCLDLVGYEQFYEYIPHFISVQQS